MLNKASEWIKKHPVITSVSAGVLAIGTATTIAIQQWYQGRYQRALEDIKIYAVEMPDCNEFESVIGKEFPCSYEYQNESKTVKGTVMVQFVSPTEIIVAGKKYICTNLVVRGQKVPVDEPIIKVFEQEIVGKPKGFANDVQLNSAKDILVTGERGSISISNQEFKTLIGCLHHSKKTNTWVLDVNCQACITDPDVLATSGENCINNEVVHLEFALNK